MGMGYNITRLRHMANVVKWLTQRVVVPSCVGSIPIVRPNKIKQSLCEKAFFYLSITRYQTTDDFSITGRLIVILQLISKLPQSDHESRYLLSYP